MRTNCGGHGFADIATACSVDNQSCVVISDGRLMVAVALNGRGVIKMGNSKGNLLGFHSGLSLKKLLGTS
jgi:hypothetical protein